MSDFHVDETKKILEDMAAQEKELSKEMSELIQTIEDKGKNDKESDSFNLIVGLNESEIRVLEMIKDKIEETFRVTFDKLRLIEGKSDSSENVIKKIEQNVSHLQDMIENKLQNIRNDQNYLFEKSEQLKISFDTQKEMAENQFNDLNDSMEEIKSKLSGICDNLNLIEGNKEAILLIKELREEINNSFDNYYSELQAIPDQIDALFDDFRQETVFSDILNRLSEIDENIKKIEENQNIYPKFELQHDALKERARHHSDDLSKISKQQDKIQAILYAESEKLNKDDVEMLKKTLTVMSDIAGSLSKKDEMIRFEERLINELEKLENMVNNRISEQDSVLERINTKVKNIPEVLSENSAKSDEKLNELKNEQKHQVDLLKTIREENSKTFDEQKEIPHEFLEAITETLRPILHENQDRYQENQGVLNNVREDLKKLGDNQQVYQEESSKLSKLSFYLFGFLFANFLGVILLIIITLLK